MNTPLAQSIALISGANGAIGQAISRQIAAQPGYEVILICRDSHKAECAVQDIVAATGNVRVSYALVDLSRQASITAFAKTWNKPVHVLVNNAAIAPRHREETPEGIEMQFATNVLGYYWLTLALEPRLKEAVPARVVNVASYWAGDLDLDDLEFRRRPYDQHQAYRQSKQINRMLTVAFAERLKPHGIIVNACHSGDVNSALCKDLGFGNHALSQGGHETPDQGARMPVRLATDPAFAGITGKYFEHGRQVLCPFGGNLAQIEALVEACQAFGSNSHL